MEDQHKKEVKRLDKMWRKRSMDGETTNDQTRDDVWMSAPYSKTRAATP